VDTAAAAGEVAAMRPRPGETSYDNALPWAEIKPASYAPADTVMTLLPTLQSRHDARVQSDPDFQCLLKDIADIKAQREKGLVSFNEAERRRELTLQRNGCRRGLGVRPSFG
jgi:carboxyl-terminal processing protease